VVITRCAKAEESVTRKRERVAIECFKKFFLRKDTSTILADHPSGVDPE